MCTLPPPIGGQAIMSYITQLIIKPNFIININVEGKILQNFIILIKIIFYLFFFKIHIVYFTCSRSKIGSIRDIILIYLCRIKKIKIINHLHGNDIQDILTPSFYNNIVIKSYKHIDATIFVSKKQVELLPDIFPKMKKVVIPNCYSSEFDFITWEIKKKYHQINNINILFISFLMETKGILIALAAFEKIAQKYPNITFNIAGDFRTDYLKSESQIKSDFYQSWNKLNKKFPNRFFYHGVVNGTKKIELYLKNDILVFPSFFKTESFGLVLVEAMRAGNAIVATDFNFISDIISDQEGVLIKPKDIKSTYNGISKLLENKAQLELIQKRNIQTAINKYSQKSYENNISSFFKSIK